MDYGRWMKLGVVVVGGLASGCAMGPTPMQCARGQQFHGGQCVPTSSLVFERCLESFRKTREERAAGVDTEVSAQVRGQGGTVHRERREVESSEYDGLPPHAVDEAIAECRRQEQQQRTLELERAWAAADEAQRRTEQVMAQLARAQRAQRTAERGQKRHEHAQLVLQQELDAAREELRALGDERDRDRALLVERHPCTAQAWDRCADKALAAKEAGQLDDAHAMYRESCEGGSARACGNWGVMYEQGLGVPVQADRAAELYAMACSADDPHACVNLGFLHEQGRGVVPSESRAIELYASGCEAGHMRGCGRLAHLRDDEQSGELFRRACGGGYAPACVWDGLWALDGRDGEPDPHRAARGFSRACEADVAEGCLQLGQLYEVGEGGLPDPARAAMYYGRACTVGEPRGCAAAERIARGHRSTDSNREQPAGSAP